LSHVTIPVHDGIRETLNSVRFVVAASEAAPMEYGIGVTRSALPRNHLEAGSSWIGPKICPTRHDYSLVFFNAKLQLYKV
jgi:hypothetical protein